MKRFSVEINGRGLCVFADGTLIIDGMAMRLSVVRTAGIEYIPCEIITDGEGVRVYDTKGALLGFYRFCKERGQLLPDKMFLP